MRSPPLIAAHLRRDRAIIAGCLLGVATVAWGYLVHLNGQMPPSIGMGSGMAGMRALAPPSDVTQWWLTFVMWAVMMVGMMSPSAAPALLLYAETQSRHPERGARAARLAAFALGYVAVWTGFSAAAATAQWAAGEAELMTPAMRVVSARAAGVILLLAGAYQLTPAKRACLRQCQSPLGFLMSRWRDGVRGALEMGLRHGIFCLGCCWALMGVLFAVGVMNLMWVAALAAFILLEKLGWAGAGVTRVSGAAMIVVGVLMILTGRGSAPV